MVKQERAVRTRRSLVRAAAEVFTEQGFASASLQVICARAGVSTGALHFHYPSKESLAGAVQDEAAQLLAGIVADCPRGEPETLQDLVDVMHRLIAGLAEDVVLRAGFELGAAARREWGADLWSEWRRTVEAALRQLAARGELAEGLSVEGATAGIVAATVGSEVLGARDREWLSQERVSALWSLLLSGLVEPPVGAGIRTSPAVAARSGTSAEVNWTHE